MLMQRPFTTAAIAWPVLAIGALIARTQLADQPISTLEYVAWAFFAAVPPVIAWMMKRSQPDPSMSQVIYDAEQHKSQRPPTVPRV